MAKTQAELSRAIEQAGLAAEPIFPIDKALAELRQKCEAAAREVAQKYNAAPLATGIDKGKKECSVTVGIEFS